MRVGGVYRSALMVAAIVVSAAIVPSVALGQGSEVPTPDKTAADPKLVKVSWDFGSGPGKTSNSYVGEKTLEPRYDTLECSSRFTLESARYEFSKTPGGDPGPAFIMFTFRKHFSGDFDLLPAITITQITSAPTKHAPGKTAEVRFPFREKRMADRVKDWTLSDLEIHIGAPGGIMDLQNPFGWSAIEISCK